MVSPPGISGQQDHRNCKKMRKPSNYLSPIGDYTHVEIDLKERLATPAFKRRTRHPGADISEERLVTHCSNSLVVNH